MLLDHSEVASSPAPDGDRCSHVVETRAVEADQQLEPGMRTVDEPVEDREVDAVVEGECRRARVEPHLADPFGVDRPTRHGLGQKRCGVGVAHGVERDRETSWVVVQPEHGLLHPCEDPRLVAGDLQPDRKVHERPSDVGDHVAYAGTAGNDHLVVDHCHGTGDTDPTGPARRIRADEVRKGGVPLERCGPPGHQAAPRPAIRRPLASARDRATSLRPARTSKSRAVRGSCG